MDLAYYDVLQLVAGGALVLTGILAFSLGSGNKKATTLGGFLIWIAGYPIAQGLRPGKTPIRGTWNPAMVAFKNRAKEKATPRMITT